MTTRTMIITQEQQQEQHEKQEQAGILHTNHNCQQLVPAHQPIYLFIDNAGGHGTDESKDEYVRKLKDEYNVIIVFQVPNSCKTNLLDLGAWMTIQSIVEKIHFRKVKKPDVLANSVMEAWEKFNDGKKIGNILTFDLA